MIIDVADLRAAMIPEFERDCPGRDRTPRTTRSPHKTPCPNLSDRSSPPGSPWGAPAYADLVSMPSIPGYTTPPLNNTLADLWPKPVAEFPAELWPNDALRTITIQPSGWLTIEELTVSGDIRDGRRCVLIVPAHAEPALDDTGWVGRGLGQFEVWSDGSGTEGFGSGLAETRKGVDMEFFAQVRQPQGAPTPLVEIAQPFLWYWDAYPTATSWEYADQAGRKHDLIHYDVAKDRWKVEVRVLEFRQYLAAVGKSAILQLDLVRYSDQDGFERVSDTFRNEWAHLHFGVASGGLLSRPSCSRALGQYILTGRRGPRVPRFEQFDREDVDYPSFIYDVDPDSYAPIRHTCDPEQLGTYFDPDGSRPHYLTPIYFNRAVLAPYAAEPTAYRITATHLSCDNLWGVDIGFNTVGLVEVYLGDIGQRLPSEEWNHWLAHNVPPEGHMEEGRFRRDILNQSASSKDIPGDLRRARQRAAGVSEQLLGKPIWRALRDDQLAEWESMIGPLNEDSTSLGKSLLLLVIAMIDGIDPKPLKTYLGGARENERSMGLLQRFTEVLGDDSNCTAILRQLYDFRSSGGVAHFAGSEARKTRVALGIDGMTNLQAFESVVQRTTDMLNTIVDLMEKKLLAEGESPAS
ncbi:hypothetical protein ACQPW1_21665 [Nocardia sp. CA-128927]|uniref:hypothetical protein n=1 Tax=Nocardia sp. CA-128927 TaxID=3239975 RepID=UPI003D95E713